MLFSEKQVKKNRKLASKGFYVSLKCNVMSVTILWMIKQNFTTFLIFDGAPKFPEPALPILFSSSPCASLFRPGDERYLLRAIWQVISFVGLIRFMMYSVCWFKWFWMGVVMRERLDWARFRKAIAGEDLRRWRPLKRRTLYGSSTGKVSDFSEFVRGLSSMLPNWCLFSTKQTNMK